MDKGKDVEEEKEKDTPTESATDEETELDKDTSTDGEDFDKNEESTDTEDSSDEVSEEDILKEGAEASDKTVPYKRFKEVNDKAKKLQEDLDKISEESETDSGEDLSGKIEATIAKQLGPLSEELKRLKQRDIKSTLRKMMSDYPDFKDNWGKIKDLIPAFESAGYDYPQAVETAYYSIVGKELTKSQRNSEDGVVTRITSNKSTSDDDITTEEEEQAYRLAGLTPERVKELKKKGRL